MAMALQLMNSILYMVQYGLQTQQSYSLNYDNSSWPLGTLMIKRPFMYVNVFWLIMPTYIMFYEIFNVTLDNGYFTFSYTPDPNSSNSKYIEVNNQEPPSYDEIKDISKESETESEPDTPTNKV